MRSGSPRPVRLKLSALCAPMSANLVCRLCQARYSKPAIPGSPSPETGFVTETNSSARGKGSARSNTALTFFSVVSARERQRSQQHRVDDAEDRRVNADRQHQRNHRHHSEARLLQQTAKRVLEILYR